MTYRQRALNDVIMVVLTAPWVIAIIGLILIGLLKVTGAIE